MCYAIFQEFLANEEAPEIKYQGDCAYERISSCLSLVKRCISRARDAALRNLSEFSVAFDEIYVFAN